MNGHDTADECTQRTCAECGKSFRHEHDCGVWVCGSCKSIDLKRTKLSDGETLRICQNCGLGRAVRMTIRERLALGA